MSSRCASAVCREFAEAERLLPVAAIWNDWPGSALIQLLTQFSAVIGLVAEHPLVGFHSADQALRNRAIMGFRSSQQDGEKASISICERMILRVAPSARAANSLLLLPPFPPAAERCALTYVESIIRVSMRWPFAASWRNRFSQMPRRAQRTKRFQTVSEGHTRAGNRTSDTCFITNAPRAGLFTVMARTDPAKRGSSGVSAFIVEAGSPGLSIGKPERKMGQHGAHVADVVFDDCPVPVSNLIGGVEGKGFRTAMKVLDRGRIGVAAACVGFAERIIDDMVAYACERHQFGSAIAEFQLVQAMIADSRTEAYAARCMVLETARGKDAGADVGTEASCCKLFASEMVGRAADRNVQVHGGAGYVTEYPAERHYRDVRLYRIYEARRKSNVSGSGATPSMQ